MLLIVRVALQQLIPLARGWGRGRGVQGRWEQRTLLIAIQSLPEVYQGLGPFPFFEAPSTFKKWRNTGKTCFIAPQKYHIFSPQICGNPVWSKPLGSIFPTAFAHFMSVSHFGNLGKHYYYYICYCDLRSCFCEQKLLPTISVNDKCCGHRSHQSLRQSPCCAPWGEFRMEKNNTGSR